MPENFENCVKNGGKIRTKTISASKYMHICTLNGKTHVGEVRVKKEYQKK